MLELAYPTLPINEWFITKPARRTLWRWLFISLMLHVLILISWELTHFTQIDAVLPVQAGQQAVSVQLVAAASVQQPTTVENTQPVITATNAESKIAIEPQPLVHKATAQKEDNVTPLQNKNNSTAAISVATNLTEGVYSEATPQSSHKPEYPRMAILKKQQGKVVIKLDIDESGQTHNIKVLKSSGYALLDNAVIAFAQMERFIPAKTNNSPIKTTQQYSFLFKLI